MLNRMPGPTVHSASVVPMRTHVGCMMRAHARMSCRGPVQHLLLNACLPGIASCFATAFTSCFCFCLRFDQTGVAPKVLNQAPHTEALFIARGWVSFLCKLVINAGAFTMNIRARPKGPVRKGPESGP